MTKTYFLAPTRDSTPSGPIALGNIIKSPRTPEAAINNRNSETLRGLVEMREELKEETVTRDVSCGVGFAAGVWANFLSFTGLSAGAGAQLENGNTASYQICTLTTRTIAPTKEQIEKIFAEDEVQNSLRNSRFTSNLYIITGVQIASNTDYLITEAKNRGQHLHLSTDLTPAGAPVTVGAGVEAAARSGQVAAGHIQGEFVFSYRLREILYKRKAVKEVRECRNGDLLSKDSEVRGNNRAGAEAERAAREYVAAELVGIQPEDPKLPRVWDMHVEKLPQEDGEGDKVVCVHVAGDDEDL